MKLGVVITAAGTSQRFGSNKQFTMIHGVPLIVHTCRAFSGLEQVKTIVLTAHLDDMSSMEHVLKRERFTFEWRIILGGKTRALSVKAGVQSLGPDVNTVMIHDGARPFVTNSLIKRLIMAGSSGRSVIPTIPVYDTLKRVENGTVIETLNRNQIRATQTPQVFQKKDLEEAYHTLKIDSFTDESSMIETLGLPVYTIEGDQKNIKVTDPSDLEKL